ncbi:MAG: hypothetical protein ACYCQI_08235 [Gammaproteobacteria bacterium]
MKRISRFFVFLCISFIAAQIHAETNTSIFTVPFQNITLGPHASLIANFSFGTNAEIFCFENNLQPVGNVTWPYRGQLFNAPLNLLLTTSSLFTGSLSDPNGTITVTNTTTTTLQVSCLFGF